MGWKKKEKKRSVVQLWDKILEICMAQFYTSNIIPHWFRAFFCSLAQTKLFVVLSFEGGKRSIVASCSLKLQSLKPKSVPSVHFFQPKRYSFCTSTFSACRWKRDRAIFRTQNSRLLLFSWLILLYTSNGIILVTNAVGRSETLSLIHIWRCRRRLRCRSRWSPYH